MGLYDRDYTQDPYGAHYRYAPQMRMSFPSLTPVVKWLLISNIGIYLVCILVQRLGHFIYFWFQLDTTTWIRTLQIWRLVSYQFLHSPHMVGHILFNMLGLYFLGPTLERHWGGRRFLGFYMGCGVAGGLTYIVLSTVGFLDPGYMVGASGALLGLLAACAILFPQFVVFILVFPVPIRIAAIVFAIGYFAFIVNRMDNAGGHAAHLGGMIAGAVYIWSQAWRSRAMSQFKQGRRHRHIAKKEELEMEVDRILQKVQESGIHSLSPHEKAVLKRATQAEQHRL